MPAGQSRSAAGEKQKTDKSKNVSKKAGTPDSTGCLFFVGPKPVLSCQDFFTPSLRYCIQQEQRGFPTDEEVSEMKGYTVENGYMGLVDGKYMLFASENDYREWLED